MAATTCSFTSARLSGPDSERCVKDRRSATRSLLIAVLENLQPTISERLDRQRQRPVGNEKITSEEKAAPSARPFQFATSYERAEIDWRRWRSPASPPRQSFFQRSISVILYSNDDLSVSGRRTNDAAGVAKKHACRLPRPGKGGIAQPDAGLRHDVAEHRLIDIADLAEDQVLVGKHPA